MLYAYSYDNDNHRYHGKFKGRLMGATEALHVDIQPKIYLELRLELE